MPKTLPRKYIDNYSKVLDALCEKAQRETAAALGKLNFADVAAVRQPVIDLMQAICAAYAESAATVGARFYELCRKNALGGEYEAIAESGRVPNATRIAVLGILKKYEENRNAVSMITQLLERVEWETRAAANECVMRNTQIDPYRG